MEMILELLTSVVLQGSIDNFEAVLQSQEPTMDSSSNIEQQIKPNDAPELYIKGPDFNVYRIKNEHLPEIPVSLEERKEQFIKALPNGCFWMPTMTYILQSKPVYWRVRWKRSLSIYYIPLSGYPIAWRKKKELREIVELAKKFGIELE